MAGRSPARFLAPIALIAVAFALYSVVHDTNAPETSTPSGAQTSGTATPTASKKSSKKSSKKAKRKTYVVKPGDTPSGIAEKTGVSLEQLEEANPDLDPQLLAPGQRIRIPQ